MKTLLADIRATLRQLLRDFRSRSKYFQYKIYVAAVYVFLLLVTVVVVIPRGPSNRLGAYVLAAQGDFVLGAYVLVRNDSKKVWDNVRLTLNGSHTFVTDTLRPGDKVTVQLPQFSGARPLDPGEVRELRIECSRGQEVYAVSFGGKR